MTDNKEYGLDKEIIIPEETKCLFIYRQNELYDKINESLKKGLDKNLSFIVLPKETESLNEEYKSNLLNVIKEREEKGMRSISDETMGKMLNYPGNSIRGYFGEVGRTFGNANEIENSLKKVADKAKNYNLENIIITLLGLYEENRFLGGWDIWTHGLAIKNLKGEEEIISHTNDYFYSSEGIKEVYSFLKKPFIEKGFNVYPAVWNKGEGIKPLKECKLKTDFRMVEEYGSKVKQPFVSEIGKEISLNPEKSGVLADRHISGLEYGGWAAVFHKHENSIMQDVKTKEMIYPYDFDSEKFIDGIVEIIRKQIN